MSLYAAIPAPPKIMHMLLWLPFICNIYICLIRQHNSERRKIIPLMLYSSVIDHTLLNMYKNGLKMSIHSTITVRPTIQSFAV